jgi:hypothetical protein
VKFTVYRDKWARGEVSRLLAPTGRMCCLGFLGSACGATNNQLMDQTGPDDLCHVGWPEVLLDSSRNNSGLTRLIINVNDGPGLKDAHRELRLTELFASGGIEVSFADGVGP